MASKIFHGTDEEWDRLIEPHTMSGAVLQSSVWARIQTARGNTCARIIDANGTPSLWVALPIARWLWVWYCPKGPIALPDHSEWKSLVETLRGVKHASVIRIEPPHEFGQKQGGLFFKRRPDISPANTLVTHILKNEEELFKTFHEKTRYNIRVAAKHGVTVKKIGTEDLEKYREEILALYKKTGNRHGIAATPTEDMQALFSVCDVWGAFVEDKIVATSLQIGFGNTLTYLHGASDYEYRTFMAPYALHWAVLQDALARKFTRYDWWGIAPEGETHHKLSGVTRFKLGFGGEHLESPGTFDAGIDRMRFGLYTALRRLPRP